MNREEMEATVWTRRGVKLANFSPAEFVCKCGCGKQNIKVSLVLMLQAGRTSAGVPFWITSGCRCVEHNKAAGGVAKSWHIPGRGSDISTDPAVVRNGMSQSELTGAILKGLIAAGFRRIGIYFKKKCIHVDDGDFAPGQRLIIWGDRPDPEPHALEL